MGLVVDFFSTQQNCYLRASDLSEKMNAWCVFHCENPEASFLFLSKMRQASHEKQGDETSHCERHTSLPKWFHYVFCFRTVTDESNDKDLCLFLQSLQLWDSRTTLRKDGDRPQRTALSAAPQGFKRFKGLYCHCIGAQRNWFPAALGYVHKIK